MIVESQNAEFRPVVITLETQQEVYLLYALLECKAVSDYAKGVFPVWRLEVGPYADAEKVVEYRRIFDKSYEEDCGG